EVGDGPSQVAAVELQAAAPGQSFRVFRVLRQQLVDPLDLALGRRIDGQRRRRLRDEQAIEEEQVAGNLLLARADMRHDLPPCRVNDGNLRLLRLRTLSQRQQIASAGDDAEPGR